MRISFLVLWMLGIQAFLWTRLYYTGDEPAYMMSVLSFVQDGDFNLFNNYLQGDANLIEYPGPLHPQWSHLGYKHASLIPAEHGTAFPLVLAIPFMLGRLTAVRLFMISTAFAATLLITAFADRWTGNRLTGTLCLVLLAISPSWQMQASRVYPETLAAALTALMLVLLLHAVDHPERPSYRSYAAIGFIGILLPVIYTKYVVISAAVALILLLVQDLRGRRVRALCAGAGFALALTVLNVFLWREQGAVGGNFVVTHLYLFDVIGSFDRYWRPFLDKHHGIVPYQPYTFFLFWAMAFFLKGPRNSREAVISGCALLALMFTGMHGIWTSGPGYSMPGRYLIAAMPVFVFLIATWAMRPSTLRPVRLLLIGASALVAVAFWWSSFSTNVPPYFVLNTFRNRFPQLWENWDPNSRNTIVSVGYTGIAVVAAVIVSKLIGTRLERCWPGSKPATLRDGELLGQ